MKDGNYIFSIENGTSFLNSVPYGEGKFDIFIIIHQKYHYTWIRQLKKKASEEQYNEQTIDVNKIGQNNIYRLIRITTLTLGTI